MRSLPRRTMSMQDAEKVINFLVHSNYPIFRVMGGEPTLHPQFIAIITTALERGLQVDVLSNATWSSKCGEFFRRISPSRILFLLNVDHPDNYLPQQWSRIQDNLALLAESGKEVTLSFNIFDLQPRCDYLLDLVRQYGIHMIRLSFSLPVLGAGNAHLPIEQYAQMGAFVVGFVHEAEAAGAKVRLDNAAPLCMFSYAQIGELVLKGVVDLQRNARCEPVIDIGPDLSVWCCFCLSKLNNRRLDEFNTLGDIELFYRRVLALYQGRIFPLAQCETCEYRTQWQCQGGCLAYAIMKHGERSLVEAKEAGRDAAITLGKTLALSPSAVIARYDVPRPSYVLTSRKTGFQMELDRSFGALWPLLDGRFSSQEIVDRFVDEEADWSESGLPASFMRNTMKQGVRDLLSGWLKQEILVSSEL
jgi:MoaA/NifB/PqqE/SkfB family radical SAM enzyme